MIKFIVYALLFASLALILFLIAMNITNSHFAGAMLGPSSIVLSGCLISASIFAAMKKGKP
jgi:hypothetical protein